MMIRLEALRTLVTVADCGNIKDAAERLHRTPSAVSMTLKQIEDRLAAPLFEADRKQTLSDLGQLVYDTATVLLRDYDRAIEVLTTHAAAQSGMLRLASVPSVAVNLIPIALQNFVHQRPKIGVEVFDTDSTEIHHLVASGQVDLGFAGQPPSAANLCFTPLFHDAFCLICRRDAPIAARTAPISWQDLSTQVFIQNESSRSLTMDALRPIAEKSSLLVRNVSSLLAMVQAGMGVTLLPMLATKALPSDLCALPLADQGCFRTVGIMTRSDKVLPPLAKAFHHEFIAHLHEQAAKLQITVIG